MKKLAELARSSHLGAPVAGVDVARTLGGPFKQARPEIDVYVDIDVGMHRCGVGDPESDAELAKVVASQEGLVFKGLMGYEGNVNEAKTKEDQTKLAKEAMD